MFFRQMLKCKVSGLKDENCRLFHSDSGQDEEGKIVEQKHQREKEEGVKKKEERKAVKYLV